MRITDLLKKEAILLHAKVASKEDVIRTMVDCIKRRETLQMQKRTRRGFLTEKRQELPQLAMELPFRMQKARR